MDNETEAFLRKWVSEGIGSKYKISVSALSLIEEVLLEGFNERRSEQWPQLELGLSPSRAVSYEEVKRALLNSRVGDSVWDLVEEAMIRNGRGGVQLIDLLEAIHLRWCTSWPFCRPPSPPSPPGVRL